VLPDCSSFQMKKDSCAGYMCYPFANETFEYALPRLLLLYQA